jgi:pyruvate formate lyase activating enzyme
VKIAGIIKNSFVDYPGQIAAVVFTQGCNYDCFYCHNRDLIPFNDGTEKEEDIFAFLEKRKGLLDGVVITGGEPTLHKDLADFARKIKDMGFLLKLDTNGSRPEVLKALIDENLLDYVAVDYKAPFDRYDEICCTKCDIQAVKIAIETLKNNDIPYELRLTFVPQITIDDVESMLKEVGKISTFAVQHYKMPEKYKSEHSFFVKAKPHSEDVFNKAKQIAEKYAEKTILR